MFKQVFVPDTNRDYLTNVDFNCRLCGIADASIYYRVEGPEDPERKYECKDCYKKA